MRDNLTLLEPLLGVYQLVQTQLAQRSSNVLEISTLSKKKFWSNMKKSNRKKKFGTKHFDRAVFHRVKPKIVISKSFEKHENLSVSAHHVILAISESFDWVGIVFKHHSADQTGLIGLVGYLNTTPQTKQVLLTHYLPEHKTHHVI